MAIGIDVTELRPGDARWISHLFALEHLLAAVSERLAKDLDGDLRTGIGWLETGSTGEAVRRERNGGLCRRRDAWQAGHPPREVGRQAALPQVLRKRLRQVVAQSVGEQQARPRRRRGRWCHAELWW